MNRPFTIYPEHLGNVVIRVDFSMAAFGATAFHCFWAQIAIAALLRAVQINEQALGFMGNISNVGDYAL